MRHLYDGGGLFHLTRLKSHSKFGSVTVSELQYADDAAFLSLTASGILSSVDMVHSAYSRVGLTMKLTKTKVLPQHACDTPPQVYVNNRSFNKGV